MSVKIIERDTLDPGGKKVDVYPDVGLVRTFVFDGDIGGEAEKAFLMSTITVLRRISKDSVKRVRDRDLPVWFGKSKNSLDMDLVSVSIPEPIASKVFNLFYEEFRNFESYIECGAYLLRDTLGKPFVRYVNGEIIIYEDPFVSCGDIESEYCKNVEFRSWDLATRSQKRSPYARPDNPSKRLEKFCRGNTELYCMRHDLEDWEENRQIILDFLFNLKGACGYKRLKNIIENYFGIAVHEEWSPQFSKYGCVRLGWLGDDLFSAPVRILINRNIDDKMKYAVLAHELSHYINHFPFLLANQIVEQVGWNIPEVHIWWNHILTHDHSSLLSKIENDAHESSTHLLIPPWMRPVSKLTSMMLENGKQPEPEEFIWRILQPLFSDTDGEEFSWVNYRQMEKRAETEISALYGMDKQGANHSLYMTILGAAVRVERSGYCGTSVVEECHVVLEKLCQLLSEISNKDEQEIKSCILSQICAENPESVEPLLGEFGGFGERFNKEILPPIEHNNKTLFSFLPLRPASFNPLGDVNNDWQVVCAPNSPFGTVEEWRNYQPKCGLILYRMESWQIESIKKM